VNFLEKLASTRRAEVAAALARVPEEQRSGTLGASQSDAQLEFAEQMRIDAYNERQGAMETWTSEEEAELKEALKADIAGGEGITQSALQSAAFKAADDKYYEKQAKLKSAGRKKKEIENAEFLEEKKAIGAAELTPDEMLGRIQATKEGRVVRQGYFGSERYWENEWDYERGDIERAAPDKVYENVSAVENIETKAEVSKGFAVGTEAGMARSKDKNLSKAFGDIGGDVEEVREMGGSSDQLPTQGMFDLKRDGFDWDKQMQNLIDMKDQITPEEWQYLWGADEDPDYY